MYKLPHREDKAIKELKTWSPLKRNAFKQWCKREQNKLIKWHKLATLVDIYEESESEV